MHIESIIDGKLDISLISDDHGRQYYNLDISFSSNDKITIYKNNVEELLNELPEIISAAIQARIIKNNAGITS